jgi:thioredoxin-related protein
MRRIFLLVFAMLLIIPSVIAWKKISHAAPKTEEIHWITSIDELQAKMKQNPKKVYVDVYTGWCGWCKKMDQSTFQNPAVIKYMNANFYAVKLDAERQDVINFQGKEYKFEPQYKANTFAVELMKGSMSYPTAVIMMENFQNPFVQAGYLDVNQLETIITYYGNNVYKHQAGPEYQKTYKPTWNNGMATDNTPPAGH